MVKRLTSSVSLFVNDVAWWEKASFSQCLSFTLFCAVPARVLPFTAPWTVAHGLLCPWDSPGKGTGVGCCFPLLILPLELNIARIPETRECGSPSCPRCGPGHLLPPAAAPVQPFCCWQTALAEVLPSLLNWWLSGD